MPIGIDTGFLFALEAGSERAMAIWSQGGIVTSAIVAYEFQRRLLKDKVRKNIAKLGEGIDKFEKSIDVIPVTYEIALSAASIGHGTGMHASDALILASLLYAGCKEIYTKDKHFQAFKRKDVTIHILED